VSGFKTVLDVAVVLYPCFASSRLLNTHVFGAGSFRSRTPQPALDPIKLIRRMTALEIALSSLQDECAMVASKRNEVVQNVMQHQCQTVRIVKEVRGEEMMIIIITIGQNIEYFWFLTGFLCCLSCQLLECTENDDPYSSRDDMVDESWESMTRSLEKQMNLGQVATQQNTLASLPRTNNVG
jgi:hypothetical protein